jgi:glycerate 2-kinase
MSELRRWQNRTLNEHRAADLIRSALDAALAAADPAQAVRRHLQRDGDRLTVGGADYDLRAYGRVRLFGAGKAGAAMAQACAEIFGDRLSDGLVVIKDDGPIPAAPAGVRFAAAGHPVPDQRSLAAGRQLLALLADSRSDDLVIVVLSGGASALLCLPDERVSLADLQQLTGQLLAAGAPIQAINTIRKHVEQLKGGGLLRAAMPARMISLVLSDVVGSPLEVIASGPTVADPTTYADALALLEHYGLTATCPSAVLAVLREGAAGQRAETVKAGDPGLAAAQTIVIGSNRLALDAAADVLTAGGYRGLLLSDALEGEARDVGRTIAAIARQVERGDGITTAPAALLAGGETTVTLRGAGRGGRNQELALAAALELAGCREVTLIALATDGGDGPTDAAGAAINGTTADRARANGRDLRAALAENDSYHALDAAGDLLRPGASGTNVNDLLIVLIGVPQRSDGAQPTAAAAVLPVKS